MNGMRRVWNEAPKTPLGTKGVATKGGGGGGELSVAEGWHTNITTRMVKGGVEAAWQTE